MKSVKSIAILLILLVLGLTACSGKVDIDQIEEITQVVTEAQLHEFKSYPNLKRLDISGSTCYPAIMKFLSDCPQVDVTYTVAFGNTSISNKDTSASLAPEDVQADVLQKQLRYLPKLSALTLTRTNFTLQELDALRAAYPSLDLQYSVEILGTEYTPDAEMVDLSALREDQISTVATGLSLLPNLSRAELMDSSGSSSLSMGQVKELMELFPEVAFHYTFELFGQNLSTDTETVEFVDESIGDSGDAAIRQALDIMPRCTYFKLEECGLSNETLSALREDYPNTKIVWRVHFGKYSVLTDTETIKAVYNVFDDTSADLKYCTDVKYIDMGHNETLTDISFMGYMPNLEIVIISGSAVKDISCFENCKKLEFLEMAYCGHLTDLSPLVGCESLRFLNVSYTAVTDLQPLDNLLLERFVCIQSKVPYDEREIFTTFHPDCWTRFTGEDPYSLGWRYEDVGETFSPYYLKMRDIFGYE